MILRDFTCPGMIAVSLLAALPVAAYEVATHRHMTEQAFQRATHLQQRLQDDLGISPDAMLRGAAGGRMDVRGWLMHGAEDEDDFPRFVNHFVDPVKYPGRNSGLSHLCAAVLQPVPSPDWALSQTREEPQQRFAWIDARQHFLLSLTAHSPRARDEELAATFDTLGHVVHLVQDAAQPQHVRDDAHGGAPCGARSLYESWINGDHRLRNYAGYPAPAFPSPRDFVFRGDGRGLSEFTNRNFISENTNFSRLVTGAHHPRYLRPALSLGIVTDVSLRDLPGMSDDALDGLVTFFGNVVDDGVTGTADVNAYMTTYSLFDNSLKKKEKDPIFGYNRFNIEAAAEFLLPRATAYSAGLLDYFFRGSLDVGIDETDPPTVMTTNASVEPLTGGTFAIYSETASGARTKIAETIADRTVPAGESLPDVPIANDDNARFIAVYQGGLGEETPSSGTPGAVIGKVFSPLRVEEIFAGPERWAIRTPKGVFQLPLSVAEWEDVTWGDGRSLIVARQPYSADAGHPAVVVVHDVARQPGSADFVVSGEAATLTLTERRRATLPLATAPRVTTINFSQTVSYRQQMGRYTSITRSSWKPQPPFRELDGVYTADSKDVTAPVFEILHEQTVPFSATIPIVLDADHNVDVGAVLDPYYWWFTDITADRDGRLLGLAVVWVTDPPGTPVAIPVFRLDDRGVKAAAGFNRIVRPHFPDELFPLLWALVDLETGVVVASTAQETIDVSHALVQEDVPSAFHPLCFSCFGLYHRAISVVSGGPSPFSSETFSYASTAPRRTSTGTLAQIAVASGVQGLTIHGSVQPRLREALEATGLFDLAVGTVEESRGAINFDCAILAGCADSDHAAVGILQTRTSLLRPPVTFPSARRGRPAPDGERLVLLGDAFPITGGLPTGHLVTWDESLNKAGVRLQVAQGFHDLSDATGTTAVVWSHPFPTGTPGTYVVALDDSSTPPFFPFTDLRFGFTLLEPSYLYSTSDMKFYRLTPPLQATRLPASLAPVTDAAASNPIGDYHIVRVR